MLEDVFHQTEQLPIDEISSAQILEFCDAKLFSEPLQNPDEVTYCSNYCYEDYNNSSYTTNLPLPPKIDKFPYYQDNNSGNTDTNPAITTPTGTTTTTTSTSTSTTAATTQNPNNSCKSHNDISIIFDSQEDIDNDISASIDFSPSLIHSIQQDQFDFFSVQQQISLADSVVEEFARYHAESIGPFMVPSVFEEDCLSSIPSYMHLNSSSPSFLAHAIGSYLPTTTTSSINPIALSTDSSGILATSILMSSNEFQQQELEYQGENGGIYCPDSIQQVFNPGDLQGLSTESQQLVSGSENATSLTQDIPNIGDQTFKVGKLSAEQRKEKIHRYMKKRNERNFSKKIKYACRKTLADSRPRVRGRFAKNDEFSETPRSTSSNNHEEEEDEEEVVKEEEEDDMVGSSDIFSHITGVNSFKCNFSIQSLSNY